METSGAGTYKMTKVLYILWPVSADKHVKSHQRRALKSHIKGGEATVGMCWGMEEKMVGTAPLNFLKTDLSRHLCLYLSKTGLFFLPSPFTPQVTP